MRPTILCAGLATVDIVYRVDRIPGADEKEQATAVEVAAGGPAANAAVTAAALGAQVTLLTAIGGHPLGELIRADLTAFGVRVMDATPSAEGPPPLSSITVQEATGERTVVSRNAAAERVTVPPEGIPEADVTLVDGHHPALAAAAAASARRLLVDAGTWRPAFADILPHAEVVACSAAFRHPDQAGPGDSALAAAIAAPHVVVTHGPDPVHWFSGPASGSVPVPPTTAVDTTGAGDTFHGALAVALAHSPHPLPTAPSTPAADLTAAPTAGPTTAHFIADPDKSNLSRAIAFATAVAGIRVAHRGPRSWLAALAAG